MRFANPDEATGGSVGQRLGALRICKGVCCYTSLVGCVAHLKSNNSVERKVDSPSRERRPS